MNPNPSDNAANQRTPTDNKIESVNVVPAPDQKAAPAVSSTEEKAAVPSTGKAELHTSPAAEQNPPGAAADPSTVNLTKIEETLPHKPANMPGQPPTPTMPGVPPMTPALPDVENPYFLSVEVDRARLVAQTRIFRHYIEANANRFVGEKLDRILDLGCGEGQLTQALAKLYPGAHVVGFDRDTTSIETARRASRDFSNLEFIAGDVFEGIPGVPYDLVYASMIFLHLKAAPKVLASIYQALKPGGYLWIKDLDRRIMSAFELPTHVRIWETLETAVTRIGGNMFVCEDLPNLLKATGYTDIRVEEEAYDWGNQSVEGRIMMAVGYGSFYNARKMVSKVIQTPESELERLYRVTIDTLMAPGAPTSRAYFGNFIARRPQQPPPSPNGGEKVADAQPVATPTGSVAKNGYVGKRVGEGEVN